MKKEDGPTVKVDNRLDTGGLHIQKIFGCEIKNYNCYRCYCRKWNNRKETPKLLMKPADFIGEKTTTPRTSK